MRTLRPIAQIENEIMRQHRISAGAMSVLFDEMPEDYYDNVFKEAQTKQVDEFRDLFNKTYPHIYAQGLPNEFFKPFCKQAENDLSRALDRCQDAIMSQGLCDYME